MLADVVDDQDVRVIECASRPRLFGEAAQFFGVGRQVRKQDLDGHVSTQALVPRAPDLARTPNAKLPDDRVGTDTPAWLQVQSIGGEQLCEPIEGGPFHELARQVPGAQKRLGIRKQRRVRAAGF